jgi:hypothetical protein
MAHLAFILVKDEKLGEIHASYSQVFHAFSDLSCIMPLLIGANLLATIAHYLMKYCLAPAALCTYFIGVSWFR